PTVDQYDDLQVRVLVVATGNILGLSLRSPTFGGDDQFAAFDEGFTDLDGLVEEATWVVSQVEDQTLHSLLLELLESVLHIAGSLLTELGQANVADLVLADREATVTIRVLDGVYL